MRPFRRRTPGALRAGWPIWTRLLGLTLVPLTGLGLVAGPLLRDRLDVVAGTRATERHVVALNAVLELRFALASELVPAETALRAHEYGLTVEQASGFMGFNIASQLASSRAAVDRAFAATEMRHLGRAAALRTDLARLRAEVDAGSAGFDDLHSRYQTAMDDLTVVVDGLLADAMSDASSSAGRAAGVEAATRRLVDAFELVRAGQDEVTALFLLTVAGVAADPEVARADLIGARALYGRGLDELAQADSPALRATLASFDTDADVAAFDAYVAANVAVGAAPPGLLDLAAMFRSSIVRSELFRTVLRVATAEATGLAHTRRAEAIERLRNQVGAMVLLVVVTAAAALVIAWSITRRLHPLAARAAEVREGRLQGAPAAERGPREVAIVARALNDTVANLCHIEGQAAALARGDLDDPLLAEPAAGGLGASIHATVQELSQAWRERTDLQERLAHQANHDLLTELPNRKAALEALELALARAHRHGDAVAVLFLDLDGFKRANDTFGHHIGDRILRTCADRLAANVRAGDVLARLGGDEFVVITERLGSAREVAELADRIIAVVGEPIDVGGLSTRVGVSIGIGMSLDGHATALDLLRDADNAVHRAKKLGKGRYEVFDERARDELAAQNELEQALRIALAAGGLTLHYQPVTDTVTGEVRGLEALARWERDGVAVSPAEFIPVAEQSDLINDLGRWALGEATNELVRWTRAGSFTDAYVAVNVSGRHLLSATLVDDVRAALDASGLEPHRLVLEITETVIVSDLVTAVAHLEAVRALGVRVALDDFGTGYTSIGQLWRLPIDVLKIDGSFIRHLETAHDHVIVELIIEVAHTLGLGLVAEGVETALQQDTLRGLQCDAIQGYLVARPQPPDRVVVPATNGP